MGICPGQAPMTMNSFCLLRVKTEVHHYLTTWLQSWYHSLLSERRRLRKAELLIRRPIRGIGELNFLFSLLFREFSVV